MKQISQLYSGIDDFKNLLISNNFDLNKKCLVRLFTACMLEEEIVNAIADIRHLLPNAEVVGATSSGAIIFESAQHEESSVIVLNYFEKIEVTTMIFEWKGLTPREILRNLKSKFDIQHKQVNILFSNTCGLLYDILDDFVHNTNISHPFINFVGGVAGNVDDLSYVYHNDTILKNGVVAFGYSAKNDSDKLDFFTHTSIAADEISKFHEVTEASGNKIISIDNTPAIEWFYDYLDVENDENMSFDEFKKVAGDVHFSGFSVISNKHNDTSRCVLYDNQNYIVSLFSSKMSVGSKFKVGYLNPKRVMKESFILSGKVLLANIESLFVYSCSARKAFLKNAAGLELMPLSKNDVSGVFLLGEICNQDNKNNLYNASCCLIGFSESANAHMHVDTSMLTQENIEGDMRFFKKAFSKYDKIQKEYQDTTSSKFFDMDYNLPNILKYNHDLAEGLFNKIAITEVITADSTLSIAGKENYIETTQEIFASVGKFIGNYQLEESIKFYILNYKTFIITCSGQVGEKEFINIIRKIYEKYGFVTSKSTGISCVNRFVVVLNQEDMLGAGISGLYSNRSSQENFFILGGEVEDDKSLLNDEAFYIDLLKRAIDNKSVTPFYQGLYNNITGKIDKYEALMRIIEDDVVYTPNLFMDIAKKFKLYSKISRQMIEKVLDDFKDSKEFISINVSLYDIESISFRKWLIEKLKQANSPENIIIEFVETEECRDFNLVRDFINEVHEAGSLFAIDDFGSGYSTFSTIINLKPDFIKIDGSIISQIVNNPVSLQVMKTICYMAKNMDMGIVAEFVDSDQIQDLLIKNGVHHSQGFLFSVPVPLNKIK
ncbi:MAG: EAL domain-containing protein [bacterium]